MFVVINNTPDIQPPLFFHAEWLVWPATSLLRAHGLQEFRTQIGDPHLLVCVLSEEQERESLLPELRDSIRLPPGRENGIYKRKKKSTQMSVQIWELMKLLRSSKLKKI